MSTSGVTAGFRGRVHHRSPDLAKPGLSTQKLQCSTQWLQQRGLADALQLLKEVA